MYSKNKYRRIIVVSVIIGALILFARSEIFIRSANNSITTTDAEIQALPSPSPFLFQEMTIPYLRSRTYTSSLGEMIKINDGPGYASYLTSYLSDGLKINGLLTRPDGQMPDEGWSAIVFVHGYIPPATYRTQEKYTDYVDYLARNGFVVFKIDLRGHGNSEGEPGGAYYSSDYIIDTLNAHAALANTDFIDGNKIGLWGHSMAGNVLLRTLAAKPNIPAVVIWAGVGFTYTDIQEYGVNDNSYRPPGNDSERRRKRQEMMNLYGQFDPGHFFWKQVAATNYLSDARGAVQLHHAADDQVVSVEYSRNLDKVLDQAPVVHEFHEYQSGGHNINGASFVKAMEATVDFYKRQLK